MNVNLELQFKFNDNVVRESDEIKIKEFKENTCIKHYEQTNTSTFHDGLQYSYYSFNYIYNNVPWDRMNDLYCDIQKYDGKISIIIHEFESKK